MCRVADSEIRVFVHISSPFQYHETYFNSFSANISSLSVGRKYWGRWRTCWVHFVRIQFQKWSISRANQESVWHWEMGTKDLWKNWICKNWYIWCEKLFLILYNEFLSVLESMVEIKALKNEIKSLNERNNQCKW